ncbi:probable lysophospholipase BODYGUARD 3 [Miscanthus floridulus]|uniref:probable lysophospholipase BODYGUARD 3 n=1 Tax=Miscanthus floridulus TaxID=154761 RepID=UPI00345A91B5
MHIGTCVWQEKAAGGMGGAAAAAAVGGGGKGAGAGEWGAVRARVVAGLGVAGCALNFAVSFVVFSALDVLDVVLCLVYKLVDYAAEAEWKSCYCAAARLAGPRGVQVAAAAAPTAVAGPKVVRPVVGVVIRQAAAGGRAGPKVVRLSSESSSHLYVHVQAPPPTLPPVETEDVVFIHGFISSSVFWTETVFPAFSPAARSRYRMFAVDLLGFGRSPKPAESLYTLR